MSITWRISPLWNGGFFTSFRSSLFYFDVMKINNWLYYISIIIFAFLFVSARMNGNGYMTILWGGALLSDIGMLWYNTKK